MRRALTAVACAATLLALPSVADADVPGPAHAFAVTREGDAGLPDHTIIRPADLNAVGFRLPIVAWANGGCRDSNEEFHYFLTHFATEGFFVVANGPPENPYHPEELNGIANPQPGKLTAAIDWAVAENARPESRFYGKLDTSRIAVMGQSCGAWEAIDASADPRVKSTISWDNGGDPHAGDVSKLHAPIAFVSGGTQDYTLAETTQAYARVPASVPAIHADNADAGHTGMWDDPSSPDQTTYQAEPVIIAPQWLALTLYGSDAGRQFFLGANCGLCTRSGWTVESKNWERFAMAPAEAPASATTGRCSSRARSLLLHIRGVRGLRLRAVSVYVNGVRRRVQRGRRKTVRLRLPAGKHGAIRVRLVAITTAGRKIVDTRTYPACGAAAR
jgi:dienelactone hydrolase